MSHRDESSEKLAQMLELLDERLLKSLFTQRSYVRADSATPLSKWITDRPCRDGAQCGCETLEVILQYSKGQEPTIIDGAGSTPLHQLTERGDVSLSHILLRHSPELIFRENATVRTPYEVARDDELAQHFKGPPHVPKDRRVKKDITTERADNFSREDKKVEPEQTLHQMLEDSKRTLDATGWGKRRLVTLNEANEVARRLAALRRG